MTAPQFRAVDAHTGEIAPGATLPAVDAETFAIVCAERDNWARRADTAERALAKFQDQMVRIQELETDLAFARSERDTWRAGVSAVAR